jgi:hypothetical protein
MRPKRGAAARAPLAHMLCEEERGLEFWGQRRFFVSTRYLVGPPSSVIWIGCVVWGQRTPGKPLRHKGQRTEASEEYPPTFLLSSATHPPRDFAGMVIEAERKDLNLTAFCSLCKG